MSLGTEVDLGPGHVALDGDPAPPPNKKDGAQHPQFWPMYCGQTAAWIKMPLGREVDVGAGDIMLHGTTPPPKNHGTPLFFRPMSVVAKRLDR